MTGINEALATMAEAARRVVALRERNDDLVEALRILANYADEIGPAKNMLDVQAARHLIAMNEREPL